MSAAEIAPSTWSQLADVVLVVHFGVVLFIVGGLALIWTGNARGWKGVNGIGFRAAHGLAIAVVVAESLLGIVCPLTSLEQAFRAQSGRPTFGTGEGFLEHWLGGLLFYDAPAWVFSLCYAVFGLAVLGTAWRFPPRRR